jgi:hypothetical protein
MQLCPATFRRVSTAKRMLDPAANVRAGVSVLQRLREGGFKRMETILLAYNQGAAVALAVYRDGQDAPPEGQSYVPAVVGKYRTLLAKYGYNPKDARKLFSTAEPVKSVRAIAKGAAHGPEADQVPSTVVASTVQWDRVPALAVAAGAPR